MGNNFICIKTKTGREHGNGSRSRRGSGGGGGRSQRKLLTDEELLHRQALALALQQHQLSQRFDGSMSRRIGSTSSRRRDPPSESLPNGKQVTDLPDDVKAMKFVLIHGEGFGAWCWYKTIALLEEIGCNPVAIDLSASGIELSHTSSVQTMAEYSKPLINFLQSLPENEKVILVGHSVGGASISYAMEKFTSKIEKSIFICAAMVADGQKPFDLFAEEFGSAERLMEQKQFLVYENGREKPATGFMFEKQQMKGLYFNQTPSKDIALAMASMRATPLGPIMEKLSLTAANYGTGRRFFVQTLDDVALSPESQEKIVRENPPERVFKIKGSDHCPFFSKPQSLNKILLEIALIP